MIMSMENSLEQDDGLDSFVQKQMTDGMDTIFYTSGNYKFIAALDKENNLYLGCDEGIYSYKEGEGIKPAAGRRTLLPGRSFRSQIRYACRGRGLYSLMLLGSGVSRFALMKQYLPYRIRSCLYTA